MRDVSTVVTFRRNPTIVLLTPLVAIVALSVWLGLIGALIVVLVTAWAPILVAACTWWSERMGALMVSASGVCPGRDNSRGHWCRS